MTWSITEAVLRNAIRDQGMGANPAHVIKDALALVTDGEPIDVISRI